MLHSLAPVTRRPARYSDLLHLHRNRVPADWIDINNHMSEAYYLLAFGKATGALMDLIGLDAAGRRRTGRSLFNLETHISYFREATEGAPLEVAAQLLDLDEKRIHLFLVMEHGRTRVRLATAEMMLLSVDTAGPKAAPFGPEVKAKLEAIFTTQKALPWPAEAGRKVGIKR